MIRFRKAEDINDTDCCLLLERMGIKVAVCGGYLNYLSIFTCRLLMFPDKVDDFSFTSRKNIKWSMYSKRFPALTVDALLRSHFPPLNHSKLTLLSTSLFPPLIFKLPPNTGKASRIITRLVIQPFPPQLQTNRKLFFPRSTNDRRNSRARYSRKLLS